MVRFLSDLVGKRIIYDTEKNARSRADLPTESTHSPDRLFLALGSVPPFTKTGTNPRLRETPPNV